MLTDTPDQSLGSSINMIDVVTPVIPSSKPSAQSQSSHSRKRRAESVVEETNPVKRTRVGPKETDDSDSSSSLSDVDLSQFDNMHMAIAFPGIKLTRRNRIPSVPLKNGRRCLRHLHAARRRSLLNRRR